MTRLVDTHCHIQASEFDEDREDVIRRAVAELEFLVVVGDTLDSSRAAVHLCRTGVFAAVGIHPYDTADATQETWEALKSLARSPGAVAIGEIGLDFSHYSTTPKPAQEAALIRQLELAGELGLPAIVHNRDSHEDMVRILDAHHRLPAGGVMHCFSGDAGFVDKCLTWGFLISFAGNVTFPKAHALREAAKAVPLDRLLVETDSPYLSPQPVRGRRCEPIYARYTAEALAALRGISLEELTNRTTANARRLFNIPEPARGPADLS